MLNTSSGCDMATVTPEVLRRTTTRSPATVCWESMSPDDVAAYGPATGTGSP